MPTLASKTFYKIYLIALVSGALTTIPQVSSATPNRESSAWSVGITAASAVADESRKAENDIGLAADVGYAFNSRLELRTSLSSYRFTLKDKSDEFAQFAVMFELQRNATTSQLFVPFVTLGVGWLGSENPTERGSSMAATAGLGVTSALTANRRWNTEAFVKMRWDYGSASPPDSPDFADTLVGLGLRYRFGTRTAVSHDALPHPGIEKRSSPANVKPTTRGNDADNDGIYDEFDICPDTPTGFSVDSDGCAA